MMHFLGGRDEKNILRLIHILCYSVFLVKIGCISALLIVKSPSRVTCDRVNNLGSEKSINLLV
jgi:hypothetical protein